MKKIVLAVLVLLLNAATARSAEPYLEEVKALGIVSGQGLAGHPNLTLLKCWRGRF